MQLNHLELLDRSLAPMDGALLERIPRRPEPAPPPPPSPPKDEADPDSVLGNYRWIARLRAASDALGAGTAIPVPASDPGVLAYVRNDGEEQVLVVLNLTGCTVTGFTLDLDTGRLSNLHGVEAVLARGRAGGGGVPGALPAVATLPPHGCLTLRVPVAA
jgi:maltose alpha-D-glucosyltransferase / alpha-amylase